MATSWGLRGAISAPAGYGTAPPKHKYVSKYFHGFFITINSMILYSKHIIHIDDFPLNGHPPSRVYRRLGIFEQNHNTYFAFTSNSAYWSRENDVRNYIKYLFVTQQYIKDQSTLYSQW